MEGNALGANFQALEWRDTQPFGASKVLNSSLKYLGFSSFILAYGWNINSREKSTCKTEQMLSSTTTTIVERIVKKCLPTGRMVLCSHMEDSCPEKLPVPSADLKREQINKPLYIKPLGFQFFLFPNYNATYLDWYYQPQLQNC